MSNQIKALRLKRGETQRDVAAAVGTSERNFARWERGESTPSARFLIRLAEHYGVPPAELVR